MIGNLKLSLVVENHKINLVEESQIKVQVLETERKMRYWINIRT